MKLFGLYINKKSKVFENLSLLFILSILSYFLVFSNSNFKIMSDILDIFISIILPSLFPFILFSNILIYSNYFNLIVNTKLSKVIKKFFRTSDYGTSAIIFGFLFGYPNGARYVNELYESKKISFKEAEYLLLFVNNSSPAFVLSSVGIGMFQNIRIGVLLLLSHVVSSVIIGILYRKKYNLNHNVTQNKEKNTATKDYNINFEIIAKSITKSIYTMCIIFGFMVIFILLYNYVYTFFNYLLNLNENFSCYMLNVFELTSGLKKLANLPINLKSLLVLLSFFLGFSSLSINFQLYSCVYKNSFKLKNILKGKILQGIISAAITYILVNVDIIYENINISNIVSYNIQTKYMLNSYISPFTTYALIFCIYVLLFCILKKETTKKSFLKGG